MYLLKITFANGLPQTSQNPDNSHQDRFVAKRTAHNRAWPWWWLQMHGPTYQIFFGVVQTLVLLSSGNPGDPSQRGNMPTPPKKSGHQFSRSSERVPILSCRDTLGNRSGNVSRKFWVAPLAKISGHHSPISFEACPDFFFRTPSEAAAGAYPEISGNPSLRGRVQGVVGLQVFPGVVSSGQLKYAVHTPRSFSHVTGGNLILTCTKCPRQTNCDVATSCYLLFPNNKNRKNRWIIQNGLLNILNLATGFGFQNGKQF